MLIILPTDIYGQTKCEFKLCYLKDGQYFDEKQDRNHWCRAQNFLLVGGGAINFNCWITLYCDEDMICQIVCTCYMKLNSNFKKGCLVIYKLFQMDFRISITNNAKG